MFRLSKQSAIHFTVLLAVAASAGWFLVHQAQKTGDSLDKIGFVSIQKTEKTGEDVDVLDTSKWKTYRNEEYGFELKYPDNVYSIGDGGYISMITLNAFTKELKVKYGDIQVLYMGGAGHTLDEIDRRAIIGNYHLVNIGGKKVYFDESQKSCGSGVGYCPVPGDFFIISGKKYYHIRRITFDYAEPPASMDPLFIEVIKNFTLL